MKRKVLFIAPKFYRYHTEITETLESQGYEVTFYPEMHQSIVYRLSGKLCPKLEKYLRAKYLKNILEATPKNAFDTVFVIRGGYLSIPWLQAMHAKLPQARFLMYQWDSVRQSGYLSRMKYFDKVWTFDRVDAQEYGIDYLPLFFTKQYQDIRNGKKTRKYDLVFFGAYHSDRLEIIKQIDALFKENGLLFRYHLYATKMALIRLVLTGKVSLEDLHYFSTHPVSTEEVIKIYQKTKAVLDIELSIQNGLTMRTFETLGAHLKLVTTNVNILQEDFYDPAAIMYIDRKKIEMDLDFFREPLPEWETFDAYTLENWLTKILA